MSELKAILKYPGGKWRIAEWIISYFPPHKVYCEPFFGSGAVFFKKPPSHIETINDISGDIVNLFRVCRERPSELASVLTLTPWAREEYVNCYESEGDDVERARRFIVRHHQSYGATNCNKNTWKNSQTFNSPCCPKQWAALPETVMQLCGRLKEAQIENVDALTLIERYDDPQTLLYLDPPYLQSLRKRGMYKHEMTDEGHERLLELALKSKSKICLSAYDSELYNDKLKGWYTAEKPTIAQMGLSRVEKLYMNYAPDLLALGNRDI